MELMLRPPVQKHHALDRLRGRGFYGLGDSNINPTTIFVPGTGPGSGFLATPGVAASAEGGPAVYQAPQYVPVPACASGPAATADSSECQAAIAAAQRQNMQLGNNANFEVFYQDCVGQGNAPSDCASRTYGLTPVGGFTSDAQAQGPQLYQDASGNFVTPGPVYTGPPLVTEGGSNTPTYTPNKATFSFTNLTSGNNSQFNVGDRWQIQITGATPMAPVSLTGGQNGASSTVSMGTTKSDGSFVTNGQMTAAQIGSWSETWTVAGVQVASFTFTVNPVGSGSGSGTGTSSGAGTGSGGSAVTGGSVTGSMSDLLSKSTTIGGASIPDWALIGGALVIAFLMFRK